MLTKEKAISIAKKARKGFTILKVVESKDSYIVDMVPRDYKDSMGIFCDGAVVVDKKNGKVSTYNPLVDGD